MNKILVVDDHSIVRHGIIRILEEKSELNAVCDGATTSQETMTKLLASKYQAVLLDISLAGESGLDLLCQIRQALPSLPVLIVSMHPEEQYAMPALRLGAAGYLTKVSAPDVFVDAVSLVLSGKRYISATVAECLADNLNSNNKSLPTHEDLSPRELQVLLMIGSGKSPTEIGNELALSVKTISTYRSSLLKKMGLKTTAELIKYAIVNKLVC
ncbi:MAG: response regulator transcription factor [Deltaproteobacteria bacterium]|nr:response regulator transcription factor [Deltaproteobacteria bacterium]